MQLVTRIDGINVVLETSCTTGAIQLRVLHRRERAITEDLKVIQAKFKELTVLRPARRHHNNCA
jgi:hypothetical protein